MKNPGADHPIQIAPTTARVLVRFAGQVVADSTRTLTLREAGHAPVQYIPREDVREEFLRPSAHKTRCPYKGEASYFSLQSGERRAENAVWSYVDPTPAAKEIAGHVAFYPDRVDSIDITG